MAGVIGEEVAQVLGKESRPAFRVGVAAIAIVVGVLGVYHMLGEFVDARARLVWATEAAQAKDMHATFASRLDAHDTLIKELQASRQEQRESLARIEQGIKDLKETRHGH